MILCFQLLSDLQSPLGWMLCILKTSPTVSWRPGMSENSVKCQNRDSPLEMLLYPLNNPLFGSHQGSNSPSVHLQSSHTIRSVAMSRSETVFQTASLTATGRPVLLPTEAESQFLYNVSLECDYKSSEASLPKIAHLCLTSHRLLILPSDSTSAAISIPLATITTLTPKKTLKSFLIPHRFKFRVSSNHNTVVATVAVRSKGDVSSFLANFSKNLALKYWDADTAVAHVTGSEGIYSSDGSVRMVGLAGILRKEQESWENTDRNLHEAFQDLNALMGKAKEMVTLAGQMRQKLLSGSKSQGNASSDDEIGSKEEMHDWLLSFGIISPVTKESAGALYHQQLSRQVADFVWTPVEKSGGIINLIDIYCLFNRARGTELISPEDLLQACSLWEKFDVPVVLRKFDSGVIVIQSKAHSDDQVFSRIKALVTKPDMLHVGISAMEAAKTLGVAPAMAKEHLFNAEAKGLLCRDTSHNGLRFYFNIFPEIDHNNTCLARSDGVYAQWAKLLAC